MRRPPADPPGPSPRSWLAIIGLTLPAVVEAAVWLDLPRVLGVQANDIATLARVSPIRSIVLGSGRANVARRTALSVLSVAFLLLALMP